MTIENVLSRFNEEDIQDVVGKQAMQVIHRFDETLVNIGNLKESILQLYSSSELLSQSSTRKLLLDLLRQNEVDELLDNLGIQKSGDGYELLKSKQYRNNSDLRILFDFFSVPIIETEKTQTEPIKKCVPEYALFQHQIDAVTKLKKLLYGFSRRALLHMPTGSGKTRTAMNLVCDHLRDSPTIVIWFANTEELCEQAHSEFQKAWSYLGNREIEAYRFWGGENLDLSEIREGFIVAGLSKTYSLLKNDHNTLIQLSMRSSLLIMDEAHMAVAPTYERVLKILHTQNENSSLLGLSATPGRTWNDPEEDRKLSDFFNQRKVTLEVEGYDNPIDYLVDSGYLAKVHSDPIFYESGMEISNEDIDYLRDNLRLPERILKTLSEDKIRNLLILNRLKELSENHKRIIVFGISVSHSRLLATVLRSVGLQAFSITSDTDQDHRRHLIERFKSEEDECLILCNYGILTTGFDAPKTSCAVITRPTDSLVLYSQMVGRAIRGTKAGGNTDAEIVTVVDTYLPGFRDVAEAFYNWEDVWNYNE